MNIQEYIQSGIVESYVLGLAEEAERLEFEQLSASYPEVRSAREDFERSLEANAMANSIPPPSSVKARLFAELNITGTNMPKTEPVAGQPAKVVTLPRYRYLSAAAVALLVVSAALNFYFYNRYQDYSGRYEQLLAQNTELARNNQIIRTSLSEYEHTMKMMADPAMKMVKMEGNAVPGSPDPQSLATVFWDGNTKDVYLMVNHMPRPQAGKQFQLWAIVNGQPVDAGVFDVKDDNSHMVKMKNIPEASAFAVTLEKQGGSPTPTIEAMYVMGKV